LVNAFANLFDDLRPTGGHWCVVRVFVFVFVDKDDDADATVDGEGEWDVEDELPVFGDGGSGFDRFHRFRFLGLVFH
jgi:hypothetical protein